jgi:hypothetical protein
MAATSFAAYACLFCSHRFNRGGSLLNHLMRKRPCVAYPSMEFVNRRWTCPGHPLEGDFSFEEFKTHLRTVHSRNRPLPDNSNISNTSSVDLALRLVDGFSSGEEEDIRRERDDQDANDDVVINSYYSPPARSVSFDDNDHCTFDLPFQCLSSDEDSDDDSFVADIDDFSLEEVQPSFENDDEDIISGDDEFKTTITDVFNDENSTLTDYNIEELERKVFESEGAQMKLDFYFWALKWGITHKCYYDLLNINALKFIKESKLLPCTFQALDKQILSLFKDKLPLKQLEVEDASSGTKHEAGYILPSEIIALALSDSATHQQIIESNIKYLGSNWGGEGKLERLIDIA